MGSFRRPATRPPSASDEEALSHRPDSDILEQIADLVGFPVEAFTNGFQVPSDVRGAVELLQIWDELKTDEDRAKLLDLAREFRKS